MQTSTQSNEKKHLVVDGETHKSFKALAAQCGVPLFEAATEAATDWIKKHKNQKGKQHAITKH